MSCNILRSIELFAAQTNIDMCVNFMKRHVIFWRLSRIHKMMSNLASPKLCFATRGWERELCICRTVHANASYHRVLCHLMYVVCVCAHLIMSDLFVGILTDSSRQLQFVVSWAPAATSAASAVAAKQKTITSTEFFFFLEIKNVAMEQKKKRSKQLLRCKTVGDDDGSVTTTYQQKKKNRNKTKTDRIWSN